MIPRWLPVVLLAIPPVAAMAEDAAAVVSKYLPPKAEHIVERAGGGGTVAGLGTPLYAGDILVIAAGGSLDIAYADGGTESLEGPATFVVPEKEPLGASARIFVRLQSLLGRSYRQGSNLATRNPGDCDSAAATLAAPALQNPSYLVAGHDNVALAWVGGCAPYALEFSAAGKSLVRQDDLKRPLTRIDTSAVKPGEYALSITSANGQAIAARIVVVADLPKNPDGAKSTRSEIDAVAFSAWLANYDNGRWRLESFQQLRPWIRAGGAMAGTYGDLVMWGDPALEPDADD